MDIRKGIIISRTNLIESKREVSIPWKGMGLILILLVASYAGAYLYNSDTKQKITILQNKINESKKSRDYQKIALVADNASRLNSISKIIDNRIDWESILQKIEENTLPEVTFSNLEAKIIDNSDQSLPSGTANLDNQYQIDLKGTTVGLDILAKQVLAFEGNKAGTTEPFTQSVSIQKINIKKTENGNESTDTGGSLEFSLRLLINPNIFKKNLSN